MQSGCEGWPGNRWEGADLRQHCWMGIVDGDASRASQVSVPDTCGLVQVSEVCRSKSQGRDRGCPPVTEPHSWKSLCLYKPDNRHKRCRWLA